MPASSDLPVVGAALTSTTFALHRGWILERQRDLEIQDFFEAETLDGDWRARVEVLRKLLDGYKGRLGIHGPFWGFKIDSQDPLIRAVVTKRLLQGLEVCEALGATQMVIHSPYTTWDYNNLDVNPDARASVIERVHATLGDVVKRAEGTGCELVIENIEYKNPMDRVQLAISFASPAVRVSRDTGHAVVGGKFPSRLAEKEKARIRPPRRSIVGLGAAAAGTLLLPRFAIGQADNRPAITIAVQKVTNSNTLDVLREQSNVGERVFFSSLSEALIGKNWRGSLGTDPCL